MNNVPFKFMQTGLTFHSVISPEEKNSIMLILTRLNTSIPHEIVIGAFVSGKTIEELLIDIGYTSESLDYFKTAAVKT